MLPEAFLHEADSAVRAGDRARLMLLAFEIEGLPWEIEARRLLEGALQKVPARSSNSRVLLFSGHRVDRRGQAPRFPESKEAVAREAIRGQIRAELGAADGKLLGITGGANGGDILFHEECRSLGVETKLLLLLPPEQFCAASVEGADPGWVTRFWKLCRETPPEVLQESKELPAWVKGKPGYGVWDRNNLWIYARALSLGPSVDLLLLWDGEAQGKGPGGTADMKRLVEERGGRVLWLNTRALFGLGA